MGYKCRRILVSSDIEVDHEVSELSEHATGQAVRRRFG